MFLCKKFPTWLGNFAAMVVALSQGHCNQMQHHQDSSLLLAVSSPTLPINTNINYANNLALIGSTTVLLIIKPLKGCTARVVES